MNGLMKKFMTIAVAAFLTAGMTLSSSLAQERREGAGLLTEKNDYGEVVINAKRYTMDITAEILNDRGKTVSLKDVELESRVYIEYEMGAGSGPGVIKLMKVLPQ